MPFIAPEVILEAKRMDLLTYLRNYEPHELVKFSGNTYTTRTHDSLKISNGKWMWWSRGIGGRNALDYLVKVKGMSFLEAVETIVGHTAVQAPIYVKPQKKDDNAPLLLPDKSASTDKITEYLFGRGIDYEIINYCLANDLIYESLSYHNAVFVGYDEKNEPKYAAIVARSITMYIFILPIEATNPENGNIISLGIGAKKLSKNTAKNTPGYPSTVITFTNQSMKS